jgi:flagellar biosynthesis protein FlhF
MFVKKFEGTSLEQALSLVKEEFGPNALILSTQTIQGKWFQKPVVEVMAASERKEEASKKQDHVADFDERELQQVFSHRRLDRSQVSRREIPSHRSNAQKYIDVEPLPNSPRMDLGAFEKTFLISGMEATSAKELSRRIKEDYSKKDLSSPQLIEKAKTRIVSSYIRTITPDILRSRSEWVAVGNPGCGKTSALVKLALYLRKRRMSASLVSGDRRKILGKNELAAYARLAKIPFSVEANKHVSETKLIDSPALSGKIDTALRVLCEGRSVFVVLDATSRLAELMRCVDRVMPLNPMAIAFTKLDITNQFGVIFDILKSTKLPILGASLGASFQMEFKFFEPVELANFILKSRGIND